MSCELPNSKDHSHDHGPKKHVPVDAALKKFLSTFERSRTSSPTEYVGLQNAQNRVLADNLASNVDMPPFVRAAMDGYAIQASDVKHASRENPVMLHVIGRITAGKDAQYKVV